MVRELKLYGIPGESRVHDSKLAFVEIIGVWRNGTEHDYTGNEEISGRQYRYVQTGYIVFDPLNPFTGPTVGRVNRTNLEDIFIIYKDNT